MIIETLVVGPIQANCFILGCPNTLEGVVMDPGDEVDYILKTLDQLHLKLRFILNTHGHFDHVGGNRALKEATGAPLLIHALDAPLLSQLARSARVWGLLTNDSPPPDRTLDQGDTVSFGDITLSVLHTPGHTPGGISFFTDGHVFVGDTLFAGSIGRTDFSGGDYAALIQSVRSRLFTLEESVRVFPGHGPETTIGFEKRTNPFFN